ncbi:hypothetical protein H7E67_19465 [Clostridium gasigenes]|uniref:hypothetical protein n=1 Tax=Clostridium gasigenes TaxID=94869 RepID=UPI0016269A88|nr:hypothetical protein [Clostridium gasigenes]MBB6625582.1 hypothetical protein [Clostridium gasigenes]
MENELLLEVKINMLPVKVKFEVEGIASEAIFKQIKPITIVNVKGFLFSREFIAKKSKPIVEKYKKTKIFKKIIYCSGLILFKNKSILFELKKTLIEPVFFIRKKLLQTLSRERVPIPSIKDNILKKDTYKKASIKTIIIFIV